MAPPPPAVLCRWLSFHPMYTYYIYIYTHIYTIITSIIKHSDWSSIPELTNRAIVNRDPTLYIYRFEGLSNVCVCVAERHVSPPGFEQETSWGLRLPSHSFFCYNPSVLLFINLQSDIPIHPWNSICLFHICSYLVHHYSD